MEKIIGDKEWAERLERNLPKAYFLELGKWLKSEREFYTVYPPQEDIFNAFKFTPFNKVNVVFIGLDPYIREKQAYGISFGISDECLNIPPSLRNIYKEVENDVYNGLTLGFDYTLKEWCEQGCFMYNTALTVIEGKTGSHLKYWANFTKAVMKCLSEKEFCIFVLLGRKAQQLKLYIDDTNPNMHIIEAPHPAAEVYGGGKAGFFGSKIFTRINTMLVNNNREEIKW